MVERAFEACMPSFATWATSEHSLRVKRSSCATTTLVNWPYIAQIPFADLFVGLHCFRFCPIYTRFIFRCVVILNIAGIWFRIRLLIFEMNYLDCFDWTIQTHSQFHSVRSLNYFHVIKFSFKQHFKDKNGLYCFCWKKNLHSRTMSFEFLEMVDYFFAKFCIQIQFFLFTCKNRVPLVEIQSKSFLFQRIPANIFQFRLNSIWSRNA